MAIAIPVAEGLHLSQLTDDDAAAYAGVIQRNVEHLARWLPHIAKLRTDAAVRAYLRRIEEYVVHRCWLELTIRSGDEIVGFVGLYNVDRLNRMAMAGYWVAQSHTGRGIATRSLQALCDFAFCDYDIHRLELHIAVENHPSRVVAERAGFRFEGVLSDRFAVGESYVDGALYARISTQTTTEAERTAASTPGTSS
jgi:ribosomal-protein-serine acetyltransferase